MIRGLAAAAFALLTFAGVPAAAQSGARVRDAGPGSSGRMLRSVLSGPHELRYLATDSADTAAVARRGPVSDTVPGADRQTAGSVVVIGADVVAEGHVAGDLVVISGDLYLHPGAVIDGRAIAIGGGIYNSTLALVRDGRFAFRDHTFAATTVGDSLVLDYREIGYRDTRVVWLAGVYGVRIPEYDRVNGLSLPFGPTVALREMNVEIDPLVTWRSDLGEIDPSVEARWRPTRRWRVELAAGRYTETNDDWIRGPIMNSLSTLALGTDTRNYFRVDRAELRAFRAFETVTWEIVPWVGARTERAWSVGPSGGPSAPWSAFGRDDVEEGMLRLNPPVDRGRISSGLVGATYVWERDRVEVTAAAMLESALQAPNDARFHQATLDAAVGFPTFGNHTYEIEGHAVLTAGDTAPRQRWAYLGGSGTLRTLDLLSMGGDQLVFIEQSYTIPIDAIVIKLLGSPRLSFRHLIGSAGVGGVPAYVQNVGVRLSLFLGRVDYVYDPESGESEFSVGVALGR